jgi:predicted nucleic acid-binding protein
VVAARLYVDASALVKLVLREPETEALRAYLMARLAPMTSRIATVEVRRAIGRAIERDMEGPQEEALLAIWERVDVIELDAAIAASAARMAPPTIRSLDAIHLASALAVGDELDAFVTYDMRLADAAARAGLTVRAPGP